MQRRRFLKSIWTISPSKKHYTDMVHALYVSGVDVKGINFVQVYVLIYRVFQGNQRNFNENLDPEGDYCLHEPKRKYIFYWNPYENIKSEKSSKKSSTNLKSMTTFF